MSDVHGNRIDRSRGAVAARWWGLGILSLAQVAARWPFRIATKKGSIMKPSSKDEVAGKIHGVKGAVKEKVGKLTNNPDLEAEGFCLVAA